MIEVTNLKKQFKSGEHIVTALDDVNFKLDEGVFAAVIGKSGAGKSTLLAQLGALDGPTSGTIVVGEREVTGLSARQLTKYRRQLIGFVFQQYNLVPNLTALENVMLPMEFNGLIGPVRRKRAKELLEKVGLDAVKQSRKPSRLSGGEQQRVAIARALANSPKLILADEPTGNLDEQTGKAIFDLLHELTRSHKTTIVAVTHDLSIAGRTDQTFRLSDGKLKPVK
jgi:putative ABC transport system ATP-binding protein